MALESKSAGARFSLLVAVSPAQIVVDVGRGEGGVHQHGLHKGLVREEARREDLREGEVRYTSPHTYEVVGRGARLPLATPRLDVRSRTAFKVQGPVRVGERCE